MRHVTIMSSKGQIVVPAEIRRQLKWDAGTQLMVQWSKGSRRLVLVPVTTPTTVVQLPPAGVLRDAYPPSTQYVQQLREEADRDRLS
jgi:AbrB family looped-hinge helix DNA binding protein